MSRNMWLDGQGYQFSVCSRTQTAFERTGAVVDMAVVGCQQCRHSGSERRGGVTTWARYDAYTLILYKQYILFLFISYVLHPGEDPYAIFDLALLMIPKYSV